MAVIDFTLDPNELGGAGATTYATLTLPSDPVAGQVYHVTGFPDAYRYDGGGRWSAQGYDANGNAVWVGVTGAVRSSGASLVAGPVNVNGGVPPAVGGGGGVGAISLGGTSVSTLMRNPLVVGGVAVAALLLLRGR